MRGSHVICIVGPTASGKSALADEVAVRLGSSVVSVDSMQVYRGMDIGTAKTPPRERRVPLLMVDVADVTSDYSVGLFQREARTCVDLLVDGGVVPVLCGGTGLYLDAVIDEMDFPAGETHGAGRSSYEAYAKREGPQALWRLLESRDEESARLIHPNNVRRVARALEMLDGGESYAEKHEGLLRHVPHYEAHIFAPLLERATLYARIDARVDEMFSQGLVDEVRALRRQGLSRDTTAGQAIGYKEVLDYLEGGSDLTECVALVKTRSRRLAKRQLSWLRRDGRAGWVDMDALGLEGAATRIIEESGLGTV